MLSPDKVVKATHVPKTFLEPLGYLAVWFALLEQNVNAALGIFLDLERGRSDLMGAQINSIRVKIDIIELLAEKQITDVKWKVVFASVIKRAQDAATSRNNILHGDWQYSLASLIKDDAPVFKASVTRKGKPKRVELTPERIMNAAEEALDAAIRWELALNTVKREVPEGWPPR